MNKLNSALAVSLVAGFALFAFTAHDAQAALVCSSPLSTSDVTLDGNNADDCAGPGIGTGGGGNIKVADVNAAFGTHYGGGNFTFLFKGDGGGAEPGSSLDGVTFSITNFNLSTTGTFDLNWTGGTIPPPKAFDLVIGLFGGTNSAIYLFDDFLLTSTPGSADGTYKIAFKNPGGQTPALSNITLFGRLGTTPPVNDVPEPASLALLGVGLLGLGYAARRRRQPA